MSNYYPVFKYPGQPRKQNGKYAAPHLAPNTIGRVGRPPRVTGNGQPRQQSSDRT